MATLYFFERVVHSHAEDGTMPEIYVLADIADGVMPLRVVGVSSMTLKRCLESFVEIMVRPISWT